MYFLSNTTTKKQIPNSNKGDDEQPTNPNQNQNRNDDQNVDLSPRSSSILTDPNNYEQKFRTSREQRMEHERRILQEEERIDRGCAVDVDDMDKPGAYPSEPISYSVTDTSASVSDGTEEEEPTANTTANDHGPPTVPTTTTTTTTTPTPSTPFYNVEAELVGDNDVEAEVQARPGEERQLQTDIVKAEPVFLLALRMPSVRRCGYIGLALIIVVAIVVGVVFGRNGDDPTSIPPLTAGTCGNGSVGNGICNDGLCCSEFGFCGCTEDFCTNGETCVLPDSSCPESRCGVTWEDANYKCGTACSVDLHCGDELCFANLTTSPCGC